MASKEDEATAAQPLTSDHDKETNGDALSACSCYWCDYRLQDIHLTQRCPHVDCISRDEFGRLGRMWYSSSPWLPLLL